MLVHQIGLLLVLTVLGLTAANSTVAEDNPYLDARDTEVSGMVIDAKEAACTGIDGESVDAAAGREELLSAIGGDNKILNILKNAKDADDMSNQVEEQITIAWLISIAMPIIFAVVVVVFYLFCCWSACPCCKCCRCGAKERVAPRFAKCILIAPLLASLIVILMGGINTMGGFDSCIAGFDGMACSSATLLDTTLNGKVDPYFIGMMPVFQTIDKLDQQFEDNSLLMQDLGAILDRTVEIEDAVTVSGEVVKLLGNMLELNKNVNPVLTTGEDSLHECTLCKQLAAPLKEVGTILSTGVGPALAAARTGVSQVLSAERRAEIQNTLREAANPLVAFKESIRDVFAGFVEPGAIDTLKETITTYQPVLLLFVFLALILFSFACLSAGCWVLREKTGEDKYNRHPHRLACCVWGCAPFLIFPVMLIGGLLTAVSVPLAGVCLTMADLSRPMLLDIAPAIGMNMSGDQGVILADMVHNCIATKDMSLNANIMDIVFTRDPATNAKVYVREQLVSTVKTPLDAAFAGVDSSMSSSTVAVSDNAEIIALRNLLGDNPLDALLRPVPDKIDANPSLAPLKSDQELNAAFQTSSRCDSFEVVGSSLGSLSGQTIPGMKNFVTKLGNYATIPPSADACLENVVCDPTGEHLTACNAGNAFVDLKRKLMQSPTGIFQCDIFQDVNGNDCDPISMTQDSSGQWQNDCLIVDGSSKVMKAKAKTCTLQEFVTYVQGFDERIGKAMSRLDGATNSLMTGITGDLKNLVDGYVLGPIIGIADGITCGFMPAFYRSVVDGLCYQGVVGFRGIGTSYVMLGYAVIFLALVMYIFWRHTIDNVNAEIAKTNKEVAGEQPPSSTV